MPDLTKFMISSPPNTRALAWLSLRLRVSSTDLGTSAPDIALLFHHLSDDVCQALNKKLNGTTGIQTWTVYTDAQGMGYNYLLSNNTFEAFVTIAARDYDLPFENVCIREGSYNFFIYVLEKN